MDALLEITERHGIFLVEDVAQALGGAWRTRKLGSLGDLGCFSFFPSKNLGGFGDGGMVATKNAELADLVRQLMSHGGKDKYNVQHIGYNSRLDTLQAAILLAKLKYLDTFNQKRVEIAKHYQESFAGIPALRLPKTPELAYPVFHQYTVQTDARDALQQHLKRAEIASMVYYPVPLHQMKVFDGTAKCATALEAAERASKTVLSLPIEPLFHKHQVLSVVEAVQKFFA
jgi:dTDP-4-amino-4,6-dideoxygalactose transaminase